MGVDARVFVAIDELDSVEWASGQRWFGPGYFRGHWPTIRKQITTLQERFPEYPVYYLAADFHNFFERGQEHRVTEERLQILDDLWEQWEYLRDES